MGVYSEIDLERQYSDNPFAEPTAPPPLAEQDTPAWDDLMAAVPPAFEDEARQQEEAEAAPAVLAQLNEAQADEPVTPQDTGKPAGANEDADEDAKRKAHEEAEAKRKAEWEARQAEKKAAVQEQLDRLAAMSDDEVMVASMKQVSADTEKITRRNMKDCVSEHIQTLCLDDAGFARKVMHPRKSMIRCFQYISQKAWEYAQDELKADGIQPAPGSQGYGCAVPEGLCYQWAVDYFNDPDAEVDKENEEEFVPRPYYGKPSGSRKKAKKETAPKKKEPKKAEPEPVESPAQFLLDGFTMPEEKAG